MLLEPPKKVIQSTGFNPVGFQIVSNPSPLFHIQCVLHMFSSCGLRSLGKQMMDSSSLVLDLVSLGSFSFLRSFARTGLSPSVLDFFHLGLTLLLRQHGRFDSSSSAWGIACFNSSLFILDAVTLGSLPLLRAFGRSDFALLVLGSAKIGSSMLLQTFAHLELLPSLAGISCTDSVSSLPAVETTHMGFSSFIRSFTHIASLVLVFDFLHLGSVISMQSHV